MPCTLKERTIARECISRRTLKMTKNKKFMIDNAIKNCYREMHVTHNCSDVVCGGTQKKGKIATAYQSSHFIDTNHHKECKYLPLAPPPHLLPIPLSQKYLKFQSSNQSSNIAVQNLDNSPIRRFDFRSGFSIFFRKAHTNLLDQVTKLPIKMDQLKVLHKCHEPLKKNVL